MLRQSTWIGISPSFFQQWDKTAVNHAVRSDSGWGSLLFFRRQLGQPSFLLRTIGAAYPPTDNFSRLLSCLQLGQLQQSVGVSALSWGSRLYCCGVSWGSVSRKPLTFGSDWRNLSAAAWCLGQLRSIWAWAAYSPSSCSSTTMADQKQVPSRPLVPPLGKDAAASNVFYRKMQVCMVVV